MIDVREPRLPYQPLTGPAMKACLLFAAGILIAQHTHPHTRTILSILGTAIAVCVLLIRHDTLGSLTASTVMVCSGMAVWSITADIHKPVEIPSDLISTRAGVIKASGRVTGSCRYSYGNTTWILSCTGIHISDTMYPVSGELICTFFDRQVSLEEGSSLTVEGKFRRIRQVLTRSDFRDISFQNERAGPRAPAVRLIVDSISADTDGTGFLMATKTQRHEERQCTVFSLASSSLSGIFVSSRLIFDRIRRTVSHLIDRYPYGGHRAILKAMTIGERKNIPPQTGKQYAQTGIAHLLAVSGLHVGIIMVVLNFLLRPLPLSKGSRFAVTVLFMFLYAGICGFLPPVSRAVIMFTLLNGALLVERPKNLENILFASLIIILAFDPRALSGASLQLSFAAVWTITTFYRPLYDLFDRWTRRASRLSHSSRCRSDAAELVHRSKPARSILSIVVTSLLATVGTAPIVAYHFSSLPVYGILANLAAVPLVGLIVPMGVLSIAATTPGAYAAPAAHFLSFLTGLLLSLMNFIAAFTSSLPHSTVETASGSFLLFAGCCLALWLYVLSRSSGRPLFQKLLLYIPLAFLLITAWNPAIDTVCGKDRQAVSVFFDVGQGDSALITIGNNCHILVDTGPAFAASPRFAPVAAGTSVASVYKSFIMPSLKNAGISRLDGIFISHPHSDHIGGLDSIVRSCDVRHIFCSQALSDSLSSVYGERVIGLGAGDSVAVGETRRASRLSHSSLLRSDAAGRDGILVLAPASENPDAVGTGSKPVPATDSETNNHSLVFRLDVAGKRILFTGDIENPIQQQTAAWGAALGADILKVPHHGAGGMSSAFIRAVHPSVAVISCGAGNRYGHPAQSTLATLEKEGSPSILVMRTDRDGSILVRLPDLTISSQ